MQPLEFRHLKLGRCYDRSMSKLSFQVRDPALEEALANALKDAGPELRLSRAPPGGLEQRVRAALRERVGDDE